MLANCLVFAGAKKHKIGVGVGYTRQRPQRLQASLQEQNHFYNGRLFSFSVNFTLDFTLATSGTNHITMVISIGSLGYVLSANIFESEDNRLRLF